MKIPPQNRRSLVGERFHVIVIGGGINGVAIARQCALGGKRTLLLEQHDFGSGTTSRSSRQLRGGIQAVQRGDISFVRESLREQGRLLRDHPNLVHPTQVVLALPEPGRASALRMRTGLWLYQKLAGRKGDFKNAVSDLNRLERELDAGKPWCLFDSEDAQCEFPERMVAEWLADAAEAGATVRNHTEVIALNIYHGKVRGLLTRDRLSGVEDPLEANWIINATGPWADRVCQRSRVVMKNPLVVGLRGSHIVLPRFPGAPEATIYAEHDGHSFCVSPWNEQILVGSTAIPDNHDPGAALPSEAEVQFLMQAFASLFPKSRLAPHDIHYAFAGIRPQPYSEEKPSSEISDKSFIHDHKNDGATQMLSATGGSLITAAELGRQCADMIGCRRAATPGIEAVSQGSFDPMLDQWSLDIANQSGISEGSARSIVEWHGKRSPAIAQMATTSVPMRAPLCSHTDHIVAEAVFAFLNENAFTLADVLLRRVPVALGRCWSQECSRNAAMRIAAVAGWTEYETAAELEAFEGERSKFLRTVRSSRRALQAAAD